MRVSKAWIIAAKDLRIFTRKKSVLYSAIGFPLVVSVGLPVMIKFVEGRTTKPATVLPDLINAFSFLFVIVAAMIPVSIASYSLVGEKIQRSLEPLLATPVTDGEILAGKSIAALIPSLAATWLGAVVFMTLVDAFADGALGYRYYPNGEIGVLLLLAVPLACLVSIQFNVWVSSRSNDIRTAQQFGTLILLPFGAVYVLSEVRVLSLSTAHLVILAGALFVANLGLFSVVHATFRREEILTTWQ